ncbi:MAG: molecular chaperone HtpG [Gammaproteobacteria bacterium]|nr:molecular chaperone HtpG [Gammaproteobacteria bacterium]
MTTETHQFQTEAQKLLRLMINSLYSSREVFLRELISNASDAIDKVRFEGLSNPDLIGDDNDFVIKVEVNDSVNELTISDNGIGMSKEEVVQNLGTIAKSGTEDFISQLSDDQQVDSNLIGQFGVGFYSAFLVADEVIVETCKAGTEQGVRWTSTGESDFQIEDWQRSRGTTIRLRIKEDAKEFLEPFRLRNLINEYSDHIAFPVQMLSDDEENKELETVNSAQAIWTRSRSDVEDKEYEEFYNQISHDFREPYLFFHNKVESKMDYVSLLYVPKNAPWDLWHSANPRGVKLYAKRVFIMEDEGTFMPPHLRWVKGVVDISDLPLNMSRETLMKDTQITSIQKALEKRIMDGLAKESAKNDENYLDFWKEFGEFMKVSFDWNSGQKDSFMKMLRFVTTATEGTKQVRSLQEYVDNMQEGQDKIYYLIGDTVPTLRSSPLLEQYTKNNIEVLLLCDPFDSGTINWLPSFQDKTFVDIALETPESETNSDSEDEKEEEKPSDPLIAQVKEILNEKVEDVLPSQRLTEAVACIVNTRPTISRALRNSPNRLGGLELPEEKPKLELNMEHPLIGYLKEIQDEEKFKQLVQVIFDQARLASGSTEIETGPYVKRVNELIMELLN